jgi:parallel beta-helix repeat protein
MLAACVVAGLAGCAQENRETPKSRVITIHPGDNAQKEAQEALIRAKPGDVIEFAEGDYQLRQPLSLEDVEGVTIRGKGTDKTRLNFKGQLAGAGAEGMMIKSGNFTVSDLTVQDTRGDGIKVEGVKGVTFRNVKVEWTRGPHPENGAYGIYPVLSENVLVEDCTVTDCSDAGIYVGQSKNVIVRRCRAERNVAGIEIENTIGADVYENVSTGNAGGMLVFSLPGLKQKVGRQCRVFHNQFFQNNHANFAKRGNIVATVPPGSGMIIMANDDVEVFENHIHDNKTANLSIMSYYATGNKFDDPGYDPYPEGISIHDNQIAGGGNEPSGELGLAMDRIFKTKAPQLKKFPDIVYDGVVDEKKGKDGKLPGNLGVYISNNGPVQFANLNFVNGAASKDSHVTTDLGPYSGQLPRLPAITIPGVQ